MSVTCDVLNFDRSMAVRMPQLRNMEPIWVTSLVLRFSMPVMVDRLVQPLNQQ